MITIDPPVSARPGGVLDTIRGRAPRGLWLEALLAVGVSLVVALIADPAPVTGRLTSTAPGDLGDPLYFAWQLAWVGHALTTDPAGLWTTNAFLQAPGNLAFTDTVLGYAPLAPLVGLFGLSGQAAALAQLNLAVLIAGVLAGVGGYALARAMGAGRVPALVAGAGFGYAPWRLEQVVHINVLSTGGIALSLALLARGTGWSLRHGWQPERMAWRWIAAGWAVACWQLTLGFATGIWFVYTLAVPMIGWLVGWLLTGRRALPRSVLMAHGLGGSAFAAVGVMLLQPYLRVIAAHPEAVRGENWLPLFSPPWRGLLTAPGTSRIWGDRQGMWRATLTWPPEMVLSPGVVLLVLAVTGVFVSIWPLRRRLAVTAVTGGLTVLALGTRFPGGGRWTYLPLYHQLPGWQALRTPGRLIIWVTLGLCLLAVGAVARMYQELRPPRQPLSRPSATATATAIAMACLPVVLGAVPAAAILVEGLGRTPHWRVSRSPVKLDQLRAPVLLLPTDVVGDYHMMLWSTQGWPVLANGSSGFDPEQQVEIRQAARTFPDAGSVAELRAHGVLTVVIIRSRAFGSVWQGAADRPVTGLPLTRRALGDAVVYDLR
ncbi:MAG TPA: hypothetical protein VHN80_31885 [Kineosporiaceae bacterium]|nr:hypothetical protein [Kineosporiaceae bacterium]